MVDWLRNRPLFSLVNLVKNYITTEIPLDGQLRYVKSSLLESMDVHKINVNGPSTCKDSPDDEKICYS